MPWCECGGNIWKTCCALHNMLLEKYAFSQKWAGELGEFDLNEDSETISFASHHLKSNAEKRTCDTSGMGPEFNDEPDVEHNHIIF